MRKVRGVDREGRGIVCVELERIEKKKEIMNSKRKLKRERERINDDLTVDERMTRWMIE